MPEKGSSKGIRYNRNGRPDDECKGSSADHILCGLCTGILLRSGKRSCSHESFRLAGTVKNISRHMVEALNKEYGCEASDLICAVGPSICQNCYEVSEDVAEAFKDAYLPEQYMKMTKILEMVSICLIYTGQIIII